jgi:hypothetical protein
MATATYRLPNGTTVTIEGAPEEVQEILEKLGSDPGHSGPRKKTPRALGARGASGPTTTSEYIRDLISEGFFAAERGLRDVQAQLRAGGHIYPTTTLSPALVRLVRRKELRRVRGTDKQWKYVNP